MKELLEYQVREMQQGIYLLKDGFSDYMYVVTGSDRAAVIDTGMGVPGLGKIVSEITDKPIIVLNTHAHLDHIGGNDEFGSVWLHSEDLPVYEEHGSFAYRSSVVAKMAEEMNLTMAPEFTGAITRSRKKREFMDSIELLKERTKGVKAVYPGHHKVPLDCSYYEKYLECGVRTLAHPEEGVWEESASGRFRRFHYEDISLTYVNADKSRNDLHS